MRILLLVATLTLSLAARTFTVAVYNVENLFDADGRAAYDEYQPPRYTPAHLGTKLVNVASVVARMAPGGRGPDLILFEEVEIDRTPSPGGTAAERLAPFAGRTLAQMLAAPLSPEAADLPAEAWLLKALEERGLAGYRAYVGADSAAVPYEDGKPRAIKNVVFSRLPVLECRSLPVPNARDILELVVDVDGHRLHVFANHWKSGAGDPRSERIRVADARVLRARLDELFAADPHADVVLGGDFNSQYDQRVRYPSMRETGLNDVLRSQGDELAVRGPGADLYNLWYDLPAQQRGSDVYKGEWGTLVQLILSRGLFDCSGVQYVEGSFAVVKLPGLNMAGDGTPLRWSASGPAGSGCSDHFPIIATFRTVDDAAPGRWMRLEHPADGRSPAQPPRVSLSSADLAVRATPLRSLPKGTNLRDGSHNGRLFLVEGRAIGGRRLSVELADGVYEVFAPDQAVRARLRAAWRDGGDVRFYGELGQYRDRWQFLVKDGEWLLEDS